MNENQWDVKMYQINIAIISLMNKFSFKKRSAILLILHMWFEKSFHYVY